MLKEVRGFALNKNFLHDKIKPEFPEIFARMRNESSKNYKKIIWKPVNEERHIKI